MNCTVQAFAKLNLMLDILGKLPKDYHEVCMLMQSVSLADTVHLETDGSGVLTVDCTNPEIPCGDGNIAYRAARAFFETTALPFDGLRISIEKHIPHAAGLAGGSADAAAVLFGLNRMFDRPLAERALCELGGALGADVPFCLTGGLMLAQYDGTVLSALPARAFGPVVIVKPDCAVSTAEAYHAFDTAGRVRHPDRKGMLHAVMQNDLPGIFRRVGNVFEQFIDVPERVVIKALMREHGAACACMSGSGPSVFGIFETEAQAEAAASTLRKRFSDVFLCECMPVGVKTAD
ncbi:MAG: 4-(cytidine 5'-diphospho)-2-C-methyl-D-erythritol kinase [Clostridia bacterium]|nr:4-(cytidine 5'-diphospho)-2-C-methyl-D-erythritol kinase [Clostridia bacterium]